MIKDNLSEILQSLPKSCTLVVVSKTHTPEKIMEVYDTGYRIFGENKVQELCAKYEALPKDIQWHLIGHLQSNKVKYIAGFVHLIHSVDSLKLLQEIDKQAKKHNRVQMCLLQIHIAHEETKFGFSIAELKELLSHEILPTLSSIKIVGLMGMATFTSDTSQVKSEFKLLKNLFDELSTQTLPNNVTMQELSIGMSGDYKLAIEEGSTMVRVGSAIFGNRNYTS
jgi:pyridoxal phosphate enzyme (YggS family)